MKEKQTRNKSFKTVKELREAIIRRRMNNPQTVVFVGPKAIKELEQEIIVADSFWANWPKVDAIKIYEEFRRFENAADGEELFFYELEN